MQLYLPTTDEYLKAKALSQRPIPQPCQFSQPFDDSYNDQEQNDPFMEFPLPEKEAPPEPLHALHQRQGETLNEFVEWRWSRLNLNVTKTGKNRLGVSRWSRKQQSSEQI
jgi:hypothetical protein